MLGDRTNIQVIHPTNKAEPNSIVEYRVIIDTEERRLVKTKIVIYEEPYGSVIDTYEETEWVSAYREINLSFIFPSSGFAIINAETYVCTLTGCETTRDDFASATISAEDEEEEEVEDGWVKEEEEVFTAEPIAAVDGWMKEEEKVYTAEPSNGGPPPCVPCDHDGDCREGYVCSPEGCCVPEEEEAKIPWTWVGIGVAAVVAAVLLIPGKK